VAVIASLSYDHTYWLGNTLAQIAYEKAGIVKAGVPTVCEPQAAEALEIIRQVCAERDSPLTLIGEDWTWEPGPISTRGQKFQLSHQVGSSPLTGEYWLPLAGRHQLNNATVAVVALDLLRQRGLNINAEQVRQGLATTQWPGRFEILRERPPLVVDCAHNKDSAIKLAETLQDWFPGQGWTLVFGASNDKDIVGMLQALAPKTNRLLAAHSHHARAMPAGQIVERAQNAQVALPVEPAGDVASALDVALRCQDDAICVTGSVFVVAEAREAWFKQTGKPLPEIDD
jgi:dihydrofolate synthase/folylpolyglutamate synthase